MKYRSKEIVEAIQWTGDNLDEISKFLGNNSTFCTLVCFFPNALDIGGYIVREGNRFKEYSEKEFLKQYEPYTPPEPELKPCPFCGQDVSEFNMWQDTTPHGKFYYVLCHCGIRGLRSPSEKKAIELWNQRA